MVNALEFINSDDIREYWKKINYQPTAQETAWLIWQSRNHNVRQKHEAWTQLINETEDCDIVKYHPYIDELTTLHDLLKRYMEWEDEVIRMFFDDSHLSCYGCNWDKVDPDWALPTDTEVYTSLNGVFRVVKREADDEDEEEQETQKIQITKHILSMDERPSDNIVLTFDSDGNVISVDQCDWGVDYIPDCIKFAFDYMWFDFPVPFKKGDIICNKYWNGEYRLCSGPVAITGTTHDYCIKYPDHRGSDTTDMNVWGYFLSESGNVYAEVTDRLMDYEYCRKEFSGYERQFILLSSFLKGEINEELLLRGGQKIMLEEMAKNLWVGDITDEYLVKAGVKRKRINRGKVNAMITSTDLLAYAKEKMSERGSGKYDKPIYQIILYEHSANADDYWGYDFGCDDCPGYFHELSDAINAMNCNLGDMNEGVFNAGYIICRFQGLYSLAVPKARMYFEWDEERQGFFQKEEPEPAI